MILSRQQAMGLLGQHWPHLRDLSWNPREKKIIQGGVWPTDGPFETFESLTELDAFIGAVNRKMEDEEIEYVPGLMDCDDYGWIWHAEALKLAYHMVKSAGLPNKYPQFLRYILGPHFRNVDSSHGLDVSIVGRTYKRLRVWIVEPQKGFVVQRWEPTDADLMIGGAI